MINIRRALHRAWHRARVMILVRSRRGRYVFDGGDATRFGFDTDATRHAFSVDVERRVIRGLAVPYGVEARKNGMRFRFNPGTVTWSDPSRVKLLMQHDRSQAVGKALELVDTPQGLFAVLKVARGKPGDRALALAEDGVYDGLSVGLTDDATFENQNDVFSSVSAPLAEISLTPHPAFDDARVSSVAASADTERNIMRCQTCGHVHPAGTACLTASAPPANTPPAAPPAQNFGQTPPAAPAPGATPPAAPPALNFDAGQLEAAIRAVLGQTGVAPAAATPPAATPPLPLREVVPAGQFQVNEPAVYRFDGRRGAHDFSTDLIAMSKGDSEAGQRVTEFMGLAFDVDKADAATLNPNRQRPDMYVDQRDFLYPLWNAANKGSLDDSTPFTFPKFNTSSGLVANHTEGVEPTPGVFTATSQTVTPSAVSGKVEITREVWDQGGNPQLSGLIWRQMTRAYYEALEAFVVSLFVAGAASITDINLGVAVTDAAMDTAITNAFAGLQFVRGGFRFTDLATQIDLYLKLANAKDSAGRPLYPQLGPMNAPGTSAALYTSMDLKGIRAIPAWALAATGSVVASSWLFDRDSVHAWATAPQRLEFSYRVAYVDLAIWGYKAGAISDFAGVRELLYDPV